MAGNKKKRQYHSPPAKRVSVQRPFRLSQCMIVKNEEKNIEKALSWAKPIAFEQIVVDTGSTDRTVEIAESMGAKVFHFEWIDDFSAAKNYAIEQAKGDWIAFLDADEYFSDEDAQKLIQIILKVENDPQLRKMKTALLCPWIHLDDTGNPFLVLAQQRVFRNTPEIRYSGSIHEYLTLVHPSFNVPELSIMHTGYTKEAYGDTGKAARNLRMIEEELSNRPDDVNLKCYLADSLRVEGPTQDTERAESLYREALASGQTILRDLKQGAYNYLISKYFNDEDHNEENMEFCRQAYDEFPNNPDICYFYGRKLYLSGDYSDAWEKLTACEELLKGTSIGYSGFVTSHAMMLFYQMTLTAEELGNTHETIRCATLVLKEDKYQPLMLMPYIQAFKKQGFEVTDDEVFTLLGKIYDFSNTKDKITVMKAAKDTGSMGLVAKVLSAFTSEELEWLTAPPVPSTAEAIDKETDEKFACLMRFVKTRSREEIFEHIKNAYFKVGDKDRQGISGYYNTYQYWGALDPDNNDYESFHRRVDVFSEHYDNLVWLYDHLCDAYSKRTLFAILSNWLDFDFDTLNEARESQYPEYFDSRIVSCDENEVFVDLGAYVGDSTYNFITTFRRYKRIYCYEITPSVFNVLRTNMQDLINIECRLKGAGAQPGKMYITDNAADNSASTLSDSGEIEVDIVRIDDDIAEPVSFIKMDIEGAEKNALLGCERQIKENKPKLAICTYHGYEDLYAIPRMIAEMDPTYKFYMRHHGGDLIPTEFHLLAL